MLFAFLTLLAEEAPKQPASPYEGLAGFVPLILVMIVGYLLLIRGPMKRQEAERNALLTSLKKNDKVLTTGGIYGTIVSVSDKEDEVTVKVDDNVRLRMTKGSIARKIEEPKEGSSTGITRKERHWISL
jgi:preprotein translocase subunit YajC